MTARRLAVVTVAVNLAMLAAAVVLWVAAWLGGWLDSVAFVSHVSMLALVYAAVSGVAAGLAARFAEAST